MTESLMSERTNVDMAHMVDGMGVRVRDSNWFKSTDVVLPASEGHDEMMVGDTRSFDADFMSREFSATGMAHGLGKQLRNTNFYVPTDAFPNLMPSIDVSTV